jgi:hypothetical protein
MAYPRDDVKRALIQKFSYVEKPSSRAPHQKFEFFFGGKKVAWTQFSRGRNRDLGNNLLTIMARTQIGVGTLNFFKQMIDCTKDYDDYVDRLRETGRIID